VHRPARNALTESPIGPAPLTSTCSLACGWPPWDRMAANPPRVDPRELVKVNFFEGWMSRGTRKRGVKHSSSVCTPRQLQLLAAVARTARQRNVWQFNTLDEHDRRGCTVLTPARRQSRHTSSCRGSGRTIARLCRGNRDAVRKCPREPRHRASPHGRLCSINLILCNTAGCSTRWLNDFAWA